MCMVCTMQEYEWADPMETDEGVYDILDYLLDMGFFGGYMFLKPTA